MDLRFKDLFLMKWEKYFGKAELPMTFLYSDDEKYEKYLHPVRGHVCMVGQLNLVLSGRILAFAKETIGCHGGIRYCGFPLEYNADFKYFLSYGIPGKLEGERYKKTPEIVEEYMEKTPLPKAEGKYVVFKRWDSLEVDDEPKGVIFFAPPDVLSGLFTLANYPSLDPLAVITPFTAGCGSIIGYPLAEAEKENPRAVIGMFDVSARPHLDKNLLSFAAPMKKFKQMVDDMDESFLITGSWERVTKRIANGR